MVSARPATLSQQAFLARCDTHQSRRDSAIDIARGLALLLILHPHYSQVAAAIGSIGGFRVPYMSDF